MWQHRNQSPHAQVCLKFAPGLSFTTLSSDPASTLPISQRLGCHHSGTAFSFSAFANCCSSRSPISCAKTDFRFLQCSPSSAESSPISDLFSNSGWLFSTQVRRTGLHGEDDGFTCSGSLYRWRSGLLVQRHAKAVLWTPRDQPPHLLPSLFANGSSFSNGRTSDRNTKYGHVLQKPWRFS